MLDGLVRGEPRVVDVSPDPLAHLLRDVVLVHLDHLEVIKIDPFSILFKRYCSTRPSFLGYMLANSFFKSGPISVSFPVYFRLFNI